MTITLPNWLVLLAYVGPVILAWFALWFRVIAPAIDRRMVAWRDRKMAEIAERNEQEG